MIKINAALLRPDAHVGEERIVSVALVRVNRNKGAART